MKREIKCPICGLVSRVYTVDRPFWLSLHIESIHPEEYDIICQEARNIRKRIDMFEKVSGTRDYRRFTLGDSR